MTAQSVCDSLLEARTAVVIDVLRATSTMATALKNGCDAIIAVTSAEQALQVASTIGRDKCVLGGERGGLMIPGFALGNSPLEYTQQKVSQKTLIMTTTNGTLAINNSRAAKRVYLASLLNAAAVSDRLLCERDDLLLVCSGTEGRLSLEDVYCAGLLVSRIVSKIDAQDVTLADSARMCEMVYCAYAGNSVSALASAQHGKKLMQLGFSEDVRYCASTDLLRVVPQLLRERIVKSNAC